MTERRREDRAVKRILEEKTLAALGDSLICGSKLKKSKKAACRAGGRRLEVNMNAKNPVSHGNWVFMISGGFSKWVLD